MSLRIGFIGTGAIANLHARAHRNIGNVVVACTSLVEEEGRRFAAEHGGEFHAGFETVCRHPDVDVIDICTQILPPLEPVETGHRIACFNPVPPDLWRRQLEGAA